VLATRDCCGKHQSTCSPPPVLTVRPRSRSRWPAPHAARTCRRGLCCTCKLCSVPCCHQALLALHCVSAPARVLCNTANSTSAQCLPHAACLPDCSTTTALQYSQHGAVVVPPCHQQRHAKRPALHRRGRLVNFRTAADTCSQCSEQDKQWSGCRAHDIRTHHATFLVVLAELQRQIAERLRARLHRHGLVVREAVLLRGRTTGGSR
jgi:hypothetical protein